MRKKLKNKAILAFSDLSITYPRIVLQSNQEALIEGCLKVLIYDETVVRFQVKGMEVCFFGTDLSLQTINTENVIISGRFEKIEYIV